MTTTIHNHRTGEVEPLIRDVGHDHPQWIHDQLNTNNESELQRFLDCMNVEDFYGIHGCHMGPDRFGVSLVRDEVMPG